MLRSRREYNGSIDVVHGITILLLQQFYKKSEKLLLLCDYYYYYYWNYCNIIFNILFQLDNI